MATSTSPLHSKRDFETAFPDVPQSSPYKKSRKDTEPQIKNLEIAPAQKAQSVIANSGWQIDSTPSLDGRVTPPSPLIDDSTSSQQAQTNDIARHQLAHPLSSNDKNKALELLVSATNLYVQLGHKKPPIFLLQTMHLQYELNNFCASLRSAHELMLEGGAAYFIPIQINNMLCAIRMKDWTQFNGWLHLFKNSWTEWFWLNPENCPLSNENCAELCPSIKKTISTLENMLALSQENSEREKLLQALFTLSFSILQDSNAFVFANLLHDINPILAAAPRQLCHLAAGNQDEKQQIPHLFKYL
jgi:hypothetical protein